MGTFVDKTGQKYGKLTVIEYLGGSKWKCQCECGNITKTSTAALSTGKAKSCGCLRKKYNIDEHYFDIIDTAEKAYILGLISSDGNLTIKPYNVKIDLIESDKDVLEKILKAMDYNYELRHYHQHGAFSNSNKVYEQDVVRLNITNAVIAKKLYSYGIVPNKSKVLDFNMDVIPHEFIRDYIRGMFDGDGSVYIIGENRIGTNLTSTDKMINKIKKIFEQELGGNYNCYNRYEDVPEIVTMIVGQKQTMKVLDYLYKDATIYLDRKYDKYLECKKIYIKNSIDYPIGGEIPQ